MNSELHLQARKSRKMKSETAKQVIDRDAVRMNNGDKMIDASTAYQASLQGRDRRFDTN